jgi:hypothetical protein
MPKIEGWVTGISVTTESNGEMIVDLRFRTRFRNRDWIFIKLMGFYYSREKISAEFKGMDDGGTGA